MPGLEVEQEKPVVASGAMEITGQAAPSYCAS